IDLDEVDADRLEADQRLTPPGLGARELFEAHHLGAAGLVDADGLHGRRRVIAPARACARAASGLAHRQTSTRRTGRARVGATAASGCATCCPSASAGIRVPGRSSRWPRWRGRTGTTWATPGASSTTACATAARSAPAACATT